MSDIAQADAPKPRFITEVLVNPKWEVTTFMYDGRHIAVLGIPHPRHGQIDLAMPWVSLRELGTAMIRMAEQHEEQAKAK
jgi:hypothetical protein